MAAPTIGVVVVLVPSLSPGKHYARVDLVGPDEAKRCALFGGRATIRLRATEQARVVRVDEFSGEAHVRVGAALPHVRHAVDGDHGELVRRREGVQLRGDGGEIARAVCERRGGYLRVFEEDVSERVDDEELERGRARFGGGDGCGEDVGEGVQEGGYGFGGACLDVVEGAARAR